jgi:S1-C subfamily serine protease
MEGRSFRLYLGTIPDYSQEGVKGVRISGVTKDSPAETAKLAGGDIIVELDKNKIENLYDYVYALQSMKPDKPVNIVVLRTGQRIELSITPKLKE